MTLISYLNPWSSPPLDVVLVKPEPALGTALSVALEQLGQRVAIQNPPRKMTGGVVHYFGSSEVKWKDVKLVASRNHVVVSVVSSTDASVVDGLLMVPEVSIVVDSTSTVDELRAGGCANAADVIYPGIDLSQFTGCGIGRKLSARRELEIPTNTLCLNVSEPLDAIDCDFLDELLRELQQDIEVVCFLSGRAQQTAGKLLRRRRQPLRSVDANSRLESIVASALDLSLCVSQMGDAQAILQSWATGVSVAAIPSRIAHDLLQDGVNAAVASEASPSALAQCVLELHSDASLRFACEEHGGQEVQLHDWPIVARRYIDFYAAREPNVPLVA